MSPRPVADPHCNCEFHAVKKKDVTGKPCPRALTEVLHEVQTTPITQWEIRRSRIALAKKLDQGIIDRAVQDYLKKKEQK